MLGEEVRTLVVSPATNKIFEVKEDDKQLSDKKEEDFHSVLTKLLFIMKM